jgi:hypothetical protein
MLSMIRASMMKPSNAVMRPSGSIPTMHGITNALSKQGKYEENPQMPYQCQEGQAKE